jgi:hypothetical protein
MLVEEICLEDLNELSELLLEVVVDEVTALRRGKYAREVLHELHVVVLELQGVELLARVAHAPDIVHQVLVHDLTTT